ncbi:alkaline phosphatase D family protein [Geodermatophilus sp. DSM 44513]|uniref:alkaline phosphatase D family protein n=1 Tax=Geodermatophilus sp. DSM 44513 TaxID=1528104 RepID=UPI00126C6059|nr:alkaline phosphatase D family protein [Geodermatophilus sp. DSM 44513]WNV74487.1 alkaline phosphatase D family protein [Geodermatophilus sp. DSM 44513]
MPLPGRENPVLLIGPLLRHVDPVSATVWVETDRPCEVQVLGRRARTFTVGGHHYALVLVEGLEPGSTTPYEVHLSTDGGEAQRVWPDAASPFPPSRIRTPGRPGPFRIAFGSCRYATPSTVDAADGIPPDALDCYAARLAAQPEDEWPDALVLLGDQVYADELTPETRRWLSLRRGRPAPADAQVDDFEDYTRLYAESWSDPQVRWLLSTIPSSMIFDDHEMIDDWNTSAAWRREVTGQDWWTRRICGGLVSYWVYQHLGNLSPQELAEDRTWRAVRERPGDAESVLQAMAETADRDPRSVRWSYVRHWGEARMVMVDSRAGRVLEESVRAMLDDDEFGWVEAAVRRAVDEGVEHLVLGTSLPWLLPHAIHGIERWNETLVRRHLGRPVGWVSERLRQAADLEHWAAFGDSFERLGRLLVAVGRGEHGRAPATALVLSGDVHHAYAAELVAPDGLATRVHQLTVSPLHNQAPHPIRVGFRIGWSRWARRLTAAVTRLTRVAPSELDWTKHAGPYFGNQLGELVLHDRRASFRLFVSDRDDAGQEQLRLVAELPLSDPVAAEVTG